MSKYIIKTKKIEEGIYEHYIYNGDRDITESETILENGKRAHDVLFYFASQIEKFLKDNKIKSLEAKIEVLK